MRCCSLFVSSRILSQIWARPSTHVALHIQIHIAIYLSYICSFIARWMSICFTFGFVKFSHCRQRQTGLQSKGIGFGLSKSKACIQMWHMKRRFAGCAIQIGIVASDLFMCSLVMLFALLQWLQHVYATMHTFYCVYNFNQNRQSIAAFGLV